MLCVLGLLLKCCINLYGLMLGLLLKCCIDLYGLMLGLPWKFCIDLYGIYCRNVVSTYARFTVEMLYGLMLGLESYAGS